MVCHTVSLLTHLSPVQVRRLDGDAGERLGRVKAKAAAHALPTHVPAPRHAAAAPRGRQARVRLAPPAGAALAAAAGRAAAGVARGVCWRCMEPLGVCGRRGATPPTAAPYAARGAGGASAAGPAGARGARLPMPGAFLSLDIIDAHGP